MSSSIIFQTSDGDASHQPVEDKGYNIAPRDVEVGYRAKVGSIIGPSLDNYQPGKLCMNYVLKDLPAGYVLYEKSRPKTPSAKAHIDRYLYGHPSRYIFRSPNEFGPHALWLVKNLQGSCSCIGCQGGRGTKAAGRPAGRPTGRPSGRPPGSSSGPVSAQGRALREKYSALSTTHESVLTKLLTNLRSEKHLDVRIKDPGNAEAFTIEQKNFKPTVSAIAQQGSFIPRLGEIVLYWADAASDPGPWRAGLITQLPHKDAPPFHIPEITESSSERNDLAVNYSGFRVETMTDPNSHNKHEQLRWDYCELSQIRPFCFYQDVLSEQPPEEWDGSILNAMKAMASVSLALPHRLKGDWPNAHILHGGIYVGTELIVVGDAVRVTLPGSRSMEHVLALTAVVVTFNELGFDAPYYTRVTGDTCKSITIKLHGRLYYRTRKDQDERDSGSTNCADSSALPRSMQDDEEVRWSAVSDGKLQCVSLSRVLGRLYEHSAVEQYGLNDKRFEINSVSKAVEEARSYACAHDERIQELNEVLVDGEKAAKWFWANDRVEALGLQTFGDHDVGEEWEDLLKKERMAYEG